VTNYLQTVSDAQADDIAEAARERVCAEHSSDHRAAELENYLTSVRSTAGRLTRMSDDAGARAVAVQ
jgi:spore maturation protein CgeB